MLLLVFLPAGAWLGLDCYFVWIACLTEWNYKMQIYVTHVSGQFLTRILFLHENDIQYMPGHEENKVEEMHDAERLQVAFRPVDHVISRCPLLYVPGLVAKIDIFKTDDRPDDC
jgi:hypothetical protein